MAAPSPLSSLLGGLSLPVPTHALTVLNGNVFGISGFVHRAARGSTEALVAVVGLILGGAIGGLIEGGGPQSSGLSLSELAASGFLVGFGTKVHASLIIDSNGRLTSPLIAVQRLHLRAHDLWDCTIFITVSVVGHIPVPDQRTYAHGNMRPTAPLDWSLRSTARKLLVSQLVPFAVSVLLYLFAPSKPSQQLAKPEPDTETPLKGKPVELEPQSALRHLAFFSTSTQFALALQLSGLADPSRVIRFLLLPFHEAFDPSLAFLAAGTIPLAMSLYHFALGKEIPRLGGRWSIPKGGKVDWKLVAGAAIFGIGWGMAGVCPGPGLVNFGHALVNSDVQLPAMALWLVALVTGGLII
ncbi:hypothetical protein D9756_001399 [Leucocoprinus leucothites]|uniref:Sulphur transport domain-containing protein n=1 Tax=Leucocoprinus leucothites TaxID=201217 RepID=A0A8H5G4N2_9AGAR|nr:hypothetical protein D9756_001399 [Leucoagaricus leucothites]